MERPNDDTELKTDEMPAAETADDTTNMADDSQTAATEAETDDDFGERILVEEEFILVEEEADDSGSGTLADDKEADEEADRAA